MFDTPTTIPACLTAFDDHELAQWLRGQDQAIAEGRQRGNEALSRWFIAIRDAAEAEQRRRRGQDADEATALRSLWDAAVALDDDTRLRLMASYHDLFQGKSTVAPAHPLAMLSGILYVILESAARPPIAA